MQKSESTASFYQLSTDHVLDSVEKALGRTERDIRATGSILALNSLENRVYQIDFEDGFKAVAKFYRPDRWSYQQIEEEHTFLNRLLEVEIPVVAPLKMPGRNNATVDTSSLNIHFAVFPLVKGRLLDELTSTHLQTLGRYLARIHRVGALSKKTLRPRLDVENYGRKPLEYLLASSFFETDAVRQQYRHSVEKLLQHIEPLFSGIKYIQVHGDCHLGNTLWQNESPFFLDFDDLCMAPAVQDIWMIVRGRDSQSNKDRETLISAYEQMNEFNRKELGLIEALRGLRIVHYSAWIAKRWDDPAFSLAFPSFGKSSYWQEEMSELQKILDTMVQPTFIEEEAPFRFWDDEN